MFDYLKRCYRLWRWILQVQTGIWPLRAVDAMRSLPLFVRDYRAFRKAYSGTMRLLPCLHDRKDQGGDASSEYFLQDLNVAKRIFERAPLRHVDVGSRVDGFVAHVASFRTIEVLDIRPIAAKISGVVFKQADLMDTESAPVNYCDSLSCLHALEHFGLGRYGDRVDPSGWLAGLAGLARILVPHGRLYLSTPVGKEVVMFNAHRVFSPQTLITAAQACSLDLVHLSWIAEQTIYESADFDADSRSLGDRDYALGIFEFIKR